jgi:hypothetical protein
MLKFYSQKDPAFSPLNLGPSKLHIGGYGCFLMSLATFFQKSPLELLKIPNGILSSGDLISSVIAKECGGGVLPATTRPPQEWCIGVTDRYKPQFPTHFLLVNPKTGQQIDPLDFPAKPEPISYTFTQYRPFTNGKLPNELLSLAAGPFPDVEPDRWSATDIAEAKSLGIVQGYPDGTFKPTQGITREEAVALVMKSREA